MSEPSIPDLLARLQALEDRAAIIDTICRFAFCLDRLAWTDFEGILADDVGDAAVVWSTLNATQYRRGAPGCAFQQQVGYYEYTLARRGAWRITSVRQHPHWQTGNQAIFDNTVGPA